MSAAPMDSAADDDGLFCDGWLTIQLDLVMDELATRDPWSWPRLTGDRGESNAEIHAELRRRADSGGAA